MKLHEMGPREHIENAVSLYDVTPRGFVFDVDMHYLKREATIFRVTDSPSSFVVLKIISGMKARNNSSTDLLFLPVRYFL